MVMPKITIGADPELFLHRNGHFISGHSFPCGTKEEPRKTAHGCVQVDGLALECNVQPALSKAQFIQNCIGVLGDLDEIVGETDPSVILMAVPTAPFSQEFLDGLPPQVRALGCNPDWNAYTGDENEPPDVRMPFRTGAGHVHIGWTKDKDPMHPAHFRICMGLAKQLDYYLGLPSLTWDKDQTRRQLYGKPGAFRPKAYGMEYRVLSNAWIADPKLMGIVYDQTIHGIERYWHKEMAWEKHGDFAHKALMLGWNDWGMVNPAIEKEIMK